MDRGCTGEARQCIALVVIVILIENFGSSFSCLLPVAFPGVGGFELVMCFTRECLAGVAPGVLAAWVCGAQY